MQVLCENDIDVIITIYLQARPLTIMPYITQTKRNIQSTNINANVMVLSASFFDLSINILFDWRASGNMDISLYYYKIICTF